MLKKLKFYLSNPRHKAVGLCFMLLSVMFAFWVTRLPEVKLDLGLSEGDLGSALFFTPLGALISMLLSTTLIKKIGEGRSTVLALIIFAFLIILPTTVGSYLGLCLSLLAVGFSMGWVDISMNAVANTVEKEDDTKIMNTSHGFFSLGGIIGGTIGGIVAGLHVEASHHMLISALIVILIVFHFVAPQLWGVRDKENEADGHKFSLPKRSIMGLAVIAFCIMMSEGAIADWSTVYLSSSLSSGPALAGFGYAAFSTMMTIGRFNGDYFTDIFGKNKIVILGLSVAVVGLVMLFLKSIAFSILGFGLIGLGYSSVIPILFSSASQKKDVKPAIGLASVATLGYLGFLVGPVIIGWLAELIGLAFSFGLLLVLTLVALALSTKRSRFTA